MSNRNSAYTLLELLIVISIFASMMAIGIVALSNFSNRSNVNSATQDFYTTSKTLIQRARNSVYTSAEIEELKNGWESTCTLSGTQFPPDAVGYSFQDGTAKYIKCSKNSSLSADFCCVEGSVEDLAMKYDESTHLLSQGDCKGVVFEYATGEIYSFVDDNLLTITTSKASCEVQIHHNDISYFKSVIFDGANNDVKIAN